MNFWEIPTPINFPAQVQGSWRWRRFGHRQRSLVDVDGIASGAAPRQTVKISRSATCRAATRLVAESSSPFETASRRPMRPMFAHVSERRHHWGCAT